MNNIDLFLVQYGLSAIFIILLVKTIGIPIPIPADLIILTAAARVAQGKLILWQALIAILIALILGGLIQFVLARGPGRGLLYRFGRYIGLTSPRLDAASARVKKGASLELWHEGICPACIALYSVNQLRSPISVETTYRDSVQST
jgi:membrane protein DedA with SNARE-associated domain